MADLLEKVLYRVAWNEGLTAVEDLLTGKLPDKHHFTEEEKSEIAEIFDKLAVDRDIV